MTPDTDLATLRNLAEMLEGEGLKQPADNLRDATESLETELARLREGLRWIQEAASKASHLPNSALFVHIERRARRTLLAEDGAAITVDELRGHVTGGAMRSKSPAPGQAEDGAV